jgi:hypothetical protein
VQRPDVQIVGDELHPMGRVKDFLPYAAKIKASGAQAVLTGNWGNDLTLLVKAAKDAGFDGKFYTFYGNALGAPAAIGDAGIGKVVAVADWLPNVQTPASEAFYQSFRARFPETGRRLCAHAHAADDRGAGPGDREDGRAGVATGGAWMLRRARTAGRLRCQFQGQTRAYACRRPPVPAAAGGRRDGRAGQRPA